MLKNYINPADRQQAGGQLPRLMVEGLLLGGTGLGVLALIFEIAADAFSVAAYQTLLAIHGAGGTTRLLFWPLLFYRRCCFLALSPPIKRGLSTAQRRRQRAIGGSHRPALAAVAVVGRNQSLLHRRRLDDHHQFDLGLRCDDVDRAQNGALPHRPG